MPAQTLTWSISSQASNGTATASGTGSSKAIGYTPTGNYNGPDSFVVQVADGNGGTDTITVNVTINAVNDPPVVTPAGPFNVPAATTQGTVVATLTFTDPETDPASSWDITGGDVGGHFDVAVNGDLTVTAAGEGNLAGSYNLTITVTAGGQTSAPQGFTINIT
ncbi:MAG: cadherin-like domain-containing protein [Acidimicrobiia bacterium]|nr:cadherin-like domain-containing protein [Acidimicrobiia bacterium]